MGGGVQGAGGKEEEEEETEEGEGDSRNRCSPDRPKGGQWVNMAAASTTCHDLHQHKCLPDTGTKVEAPAHRSQDHTHTHKIHSLKPSLTLKYTLQLWLRHAHQKHGPKLSSSSRQTPFRQRRTGATSVPWEIP